MSAPDHTQRPDAAPVAPVIAKARAHPRHPLAAASARQSTARQVLENRESTDRQYQLVRRAAESREAGERVMASVTRFLEGVLRLRVNRQKSAVAFCEER